jgi:spore coat protein U-like protein
VLGSLLTAPLPIAFAASSTPVSMPISASVAPICVVNSASLDFGAYDPIVANAATPLDATGTISIQCLKNSNYTVEIGAGLNGTAGPLRNMKEAGGTLLNYELYTDSTRATIWNATNTVGGTAADSSPISLIVYGRIPAGQNVVAASYSDTVDVTVNF